MKKIFYFILAVVLVSACQPETPIAVSEEENKSKSATLYKNNIPLQWNRLFLEAERYTPGYRPPVSARSSAYINMAVYESIVQSSGHSYKSLQGNYDGLTIRAIDQNAIYNWEVVAHTAYERSFEHFFPTLPAKQQLDILEAAKTLKEELEKNETAEVYQRSVDYGQYVADQVYDWSRTDTYGDQAYLKNTDSSYEPPLSAGLWKPTYPDFLPALLPYWGKVRTFSSQVRLSVPPPPTYDTDPGCRMYREATQTMNLVQNIKDGNLEEQHWIAEFWSDDCPILTFTPSGRWISISNQVVQIERQSLMEAVATYAKVGMALSDAGVGCWREKYRHNCLRPIDYIRKHMGAPQWNTVMCPNGSGNFFTPNFPSYPSGHATFAAAAAEVLTDIFGENYSFTDRSHEGRTEFRGMPRSFNSFDEMSIENAYSRVPLGVHFLADSKAGTLMGGHIGKAISDLPWK